MTIQALPMIIKSRGNIINLSSVGASHPGVNLSMYVGAKAAVENFTKAWALELASSGVRVNAIAPGAIRTIIYGMYLVLVRKKLKNMKIVLPRRFLFKDLEQ